MKSRNWRMVQRLPETEKNQPGRPTSVASPTGLCRERAFHTPPQ
jgi:hypothetical protein